MCHPHCHRANEDGGGVHRKIRRIHMYTRHITSTYGARYMPRVHVQVRYHTGIPLVRKSDTVPVPLVPAPERVRVVPYLHTYKGMVNTRRFLHGRYDNRGYLTCQLK
jgi:hypothetical protein